ncbi:MAG: SDR family oxidoreductase, partial [Rhodobacteraceae bacterium]|nr:SDR family oxidoreductase [Paracoccaceae bacterium]
NFLPDIPIDQARRVIEVNLLGVLFGMQAQLRGMKTGAIVNVASTAGIRGAPKMAVYAASKHGVVGLTKSAALENARRGIRVNAVCPSFARTPMAGEANDSLAIEAEMTSFVPMRRLATVSEVVQAALWLADPANSFVTGLALGVDGGMVAM